MNPYYRQTLIDELTNIFRDVHDEITADPAFNGNAMVEVAEFGERLLQEWNINRSEHDGIISHALSNAGVTSE